MSDLDVAALRAQIPALQQMIYLNTGTSGPLPGVVTARIRELLAREAIEGPAAPELLSAGAKEMMATRQAIARLLQVDCDEVALTQNATHGLTIVATGYPWQPGDEILTTSQEHSSGLLPWYALAQHRGVRVRLVPVDSDPEVTLRAFAEAITPSTRLIAFSHVAYSTGLRLPAEQLCRLARERGVLTAIDGAQAAGQMAMDLHALGCDYYALPGQKWLLGPDGTGAFYARAESLERLNPAAIGWASVADYAFEAPAYTPHRSARRFEVATMSVPLVGGLRAAVEFALENGLDRIRGRIAALAGVLKGRLAAIPGVTLLTPMDAERSAGLVSFTVDGVDAEKAARRLWTERRILCRSIPSPYCLRFSVHAFNTEEEVVLAADSVAALV